MAKTTHRTAGWRAALAAAGMAVLVAAGLPGSASAQTTATFGTGLTVASSAQIAADPVGSQTNIGARLNANQTLSGGQRLVSPSGQFNVSMFDAEGIGRVPLMYSRTCGWSTALPLGSGHTGSLDTRLVMQGDGNLVTLQGNKVIWHAGTFNNPGAYLAVQDDSNLVVYSSANRPLWASGRQCDRIFTMENRANWKANGLDDALHMNPGDVMYSPDGSKRLVMQGDGNLVLYRGSTPLWHTRTSGNPGAYLVAQPDGNIVLYRSGRALWQTGTRWTTSGTNEGIQLMVQNDGNLVAYHWANIDTTAVTVQWNSGSRG